MSSPGRSLANEHGRLDALPQRHGRRRRLDLRRLGTSRASGGSGPVQLTTSLRHAANFRGLVGTALIAYAWDYVHSESRMIRVIIFPQIRGRCREGMAVRGAALAGMGRRCMQWDLQACRLGFRVQYVWFLGCLGNSYLLMYILFVRVYSCKVVLVRSNVFITSSKHPRGTSSPSCFSTTTPTLISHWL
jgi:hypothetical protein